MDSVWMLAVWVGVGTSAMMALLWAVHLRIRNAGVVDFGWALGLGLSAVVYAVFADGEWSRRLALGLIGGGWGLRLAWHLLTDRVIGAPEDGRYQMLRERWGDAFGRHMIWFFQAQALTVVILSIPFLLASTDRGGFPVTTDLLGLGLWLTGIVGEAVADEQLKRFKRRSDSRGRTCREGLWRYSRHPNYFFEWVIWLGFGVFALGAEHGWLGLLAPALLLVLILKVTGIPPTEARALASRGEDYRKYQRETSAFFPWFVKRSEP